MKEPVSALSVPWDASRIINLGVISLVIIIFYLGNYHAELDEMARHWWADMAWTIAALATGVRCIITARKFDGHYRKAWNFIGYACFSWFAGMLAWDYQELVLHDTIPFPGISDIGFILFAPLLMIGVLYYRFQTPSVSLTIKQISELGIILCAIVISLIVILHEPIAGLNESLLYVVTALAYPVLYMGVFFFGLVHPFSRPKEEGKVITALLVIGIGVHAFTDTVYAYSLLGKSYDVGNYLDILWLTGFAFIYWSAFEQSKLATIKETREKNMPHFDNEFEALIPAIVTAWVVLLVFLFEESITPQVTLYVFPIVIVMVAFMALLGWFNRSLQKKLYRKALSSKEQLIRAYNELDQRVMERTKELEIAKDQAEKASKAKSEILSRMSHELRTPLNAVIGYSQLLDIDKQNPLTPRQSKNAKEILNAGRHLLDLINEVLDLAAVESGKFKFDIKKISVNSVIDECVQMVKPIAGQNGICIQTETGNQDLYVNLDQVRFKQVFLNLLSNAIKFNQPSGMVFIGTKTTDNGKIHVSIRDTGPGIPEEHHKDLFNPFSRFNKSNIEGTGIGLAVARQLTEAMQGNIGVSSIMGEGSTFWLEFNMATE